MFTSEKILLKKIVRFFFFFSELNLLWEEFFLEFRYSYIFGKNCLSQKNFHKKQTNMFQMLSSYSMHLDYGSFSQRYPQDEPIHCCPCKQSDSGRTKMWLSSWCPKHSDRQENFLLLVVRNKHHTCDNTIIHMHAHKPRQNLYSLYRKNIH